jgi:fused signal recognition particle receptor
MILTPEGCMVLQFLKTSYTKVKDALSKARSLLGGKIRSLFQGKIDEETLEQLEQLLYEADFGVQTAVELTQKIRELHKQNPSFKTADYLEALRKEIIQILNRQPSSLVEVPQAEWPRVILIVGVNGNGKTTSVAKLANLFKSNGQKVLVGAADTFRAAAIEQLETWAQVLQIDIVRVLPKAIRLP